jgi:hypothetical protein
MHGYALFIIPHKNEMAHTCNKELHKSHYCQKQVPQPNPDVASCIHNSRVLKAFDNSLTAQGGQEQSHKSQA